MLKNWDNYRNIFPERYWGYGFFDDFLKNLLETQNFSSCLDIGGGVHGTPVLKGGIFEKVLLDPFITEYPDWYSKKINWEDLVDKYELIVSRGSFNYLSEEQIKMVINALEDKGSLYFNTFFSPPKNNWTTREFLNKSGVSGVESFRLVKDVVEHKLEVSGNVVEHSFYYRPLSRYIDLFEKFRVSTYTYGKNSIILKVTNGSF